MNPERTPEELQAGWQQIVGTVQEHVEKIEKKLSGAQRKQQARQGRLVTLAPRKPRRPKAPRPAPDVQIARGPITSGTYVQVQAAYRKRKQVQYAGRFYRVAYVRVNDVGNFEARLVEVV